MNNEDVKKMRDKLKSLIGSAPCPESHDLRVEWSKNHGNQRETRFSFLSGHNERVPCHLLVPNNSANPPVVICLQGHSRGMHISLGNPRFPGDEKSIAGGRDFAVQAVSRGYAALTIEQAAFGERSGRENFETNCHIPAMRELLFGRTMIGRRVQDVSRAIDVLQQTEIGNGIDTSRIACMGNSGGGTTTFYAACLDMRISAAMPSCSFCSFEKSIETIHHCVCNFVPQILNHFEMGDLAALVAPRPLVVVAGRSDEIFPLDGVEDAMGKASEAYRSAGAEDALCLVVGEGGHQFYPGEAWPEFCRRFSSK